jgi:hypothetical protein
LFTSEDRINITSPPYAFELFGNTVGIWVTHRKQRLQRSARKAAALVVIETSGMTVQLKRAPEAIETDKH